MSLADNSASSKATSASCRGRGTTPASCCTIDPTVAAPNPTSSTVPAHRGYRSDPEFVVRENAMMIMMM